MKQLALYPSFWLPPMRSKIKSSDWTVSSLPNLMKIPVVWVT